MRFSCDGMHAAAEPGAEHVRWRVQSPGGVRTASDASLACRRARQISAKPATHGNHLDGSPFVEAASFLSAAAHGRPSLGSRAAHRPSVTMPAPPLPPEAASAPEGLSEPLFCRVSFTRSPEIEIELLRMPHPGLYRVIL